MPIIDEYKGNLITEVLAGKLDVIAHCCNCFCTQKLGLAKRMVEAFETNTFPMEDEQRIGDINKLGCIEFKIRKINETKNAWIVNMYGQYHWKDPGPYGIPCDYDALRLCFRKLNSEFEYNTVGIPGLIGCGLAKGNPSIVRKIIEEECTNCDIVIITL